MEKKIPSRELALGGFLTIMATIFGKIEFNWIGFLYVSFCMIIGFMNWIEIDKLNSPSKPKTK